MGQTLIQLSQKSLSTPPIFPNRFVVEVCEKVHVHYKNVRFVMTLHDWVNMSEGFKDALERWKKRGCPGTGKGVHIELCRKKIISESENSSVLINLNKNLYADIVNKDRVFAEGAGFEDPQYLHIKIGDFRIELSLDHFKEVCDAFAEAKERIKNSNHSSMLQET